MKGKNIIQYGFFMVLGSYLLYFTYRDISWEEFVEIGHKVKLRWVFLAILAHLINHFFRAFRWRLLVRAQGYVVSNGYAFLAEMSGFCMNIVPPRMGEWIRCVVLKRLEGVPVSSGLGGVVVERFIDIFLFLSLLGLAFSMEFFTDSNVLTGLIRKLMDKGGSDGGGRLLSSKAVSVIVILVGLLLVIFFMGKKRRFFTLIWEKAKLFLEELFLAIKETRKSNSWVLWMSSLCILVFHFMVEYLSFYAIEEIKIGWLGAFYIFIMMNVGMAAPTPGGIGVYHMAVISTLTAMGVEYKYAVMYTTITHSVQLFNALVVGGTSFLVSNFLPKAETR